jgi:CheY-like chemotaxis protein
VLQILALVFHRNNSLMRGNISTRRNNHIKKQQYKGRDEWHLICPFKAYLLKMIKSKKLVYIVDDDPDDRQIILDAFLEHQPELDYIFAEGAEELMDLLSGIPEDDPTEHPSLIILDLNMPGMMGLQALKEIRSNKKYAHIPMVVMTTSTLGSDRKRSYELGANCFITKPSLYTDLVDTTKSISKVYFLEDYQESGQKEMSNH